MTDDGRSTFPAWGLPSLSWLVSFYFLLSFVANVGFPPDRKLLTGDFAYVFLWLLFLFLPFFSKIKIGSFLELEREVAKAKEELREFKAEMRNSISVLSTNVNTIGGMSNQVTVNIPGVAELREARQIVEEKVPLMATETAQEVEERIFIQSEDKTLALARTRIEIERILRQILGKRTRTTPATERPVKFLRIGQLFEIFTAQNPEFSYLATPFKYFTQVSNAVIHAQRVGEEQALEALGLGVDILAVLNEYCAGAQKTE